MLAGLLMALIYIGGETAQISMSLPSATTAVFQGMFLFFLLACDVLVNYRLRWTWRMANARGRIRHGSAVAAAHPHSAARSAGGVKLPMDLLANILIGAMIAATPLVLAATGELVAERAGVLNLGVEGMMIVGAIAGFSAMIATGSVIVALLAAIAAGARHGRPVRHSRAHACAPTRSPPAWL